MVIFHCYVSSPEGSLYLLLVQCYFFVVKIVNDIVNTYIFLKYINRMMLNIGRGVLYFFLSDPDQSPTGDPRSGDCQQSVRWCPVRKMIQQ